MRLLFPSLAGVHAHRKHSWFCYHFLSDSDWKLLRLHCLLVWWKVDKTPELFILCLSCIGRRGAGYPGRRVLDRTYVPPLSSWFVQYAALRCLPVQCVRTCRRSRFFLLLALILVPSTDICNTFPFLIKRFRSMASLLHSFYPSFNRYSINTFDVYEFLTPGSHFGLHSHSCFQDILKIWNFWCRIFHNLHKNNARFGDFQ